VGGKDLYGHGAVEPGIAGAATAHSAQAELVKKLIKQGTRVITVALRMPYDLAVYPAASTYVCTYSILPPSMDALAEALGLPGSSRAWSEPTPSRSPL